MNKIKIDLGEIKNSCFVVMPFSSFFQIEYEKIIKPTIEELGILCIRGDEIYSKQRIVDDIWKEIRQCRFVLAELSGKNPNVLYEIGLAHAIGKPVIILTRYADDVPFDLKSLRYLFYNVDDPFWGENLKRGIASLLYKIIENPEIDTYLEGVNSAKIKYPEIEKIKLKEKVDKNININIDGTWIGSFIDKFKSKERRNEVTLQLSQNKNSVLGTAIITYQIKEVRTVVQEMINGTILGDNFVNLVGVNYTFIERGNEVVYFLENLELQFISEFETLKGHLFSDPKYGIEKTEIEFKRTKTAKIS